MARCNTCGSTILFGGKFNKGFRYCDDSCEEQGRLLALAAQLPEDFVAQEVAEVHQGECPYCGSAGPVDVYTSYTAWSAFIITTWRSNPKISCRFCGIKSKIWATTFSGITGWWGIPWGLIATPIQIMRNFLGLFSHPHPMRPSPELEKLVRIQLASRIVAERVTEQVVDSPQ